MPTLSGVIKRLLFLCFCLVARRECGWWISLLLQTQIFMHIILLCFVLLQSSFCHCKYLLYHHDGCQKGSVYYNKVFLNYPGLDALHHFTWFSAKPRFVSEPCYLPGWPILLLSCLNTVSHHAQRCVNCLCAATVERVGQERPKQLNWSCAIWQPYITNLTSRNR